MLNAGYDCGDIGGGYGIESEGFDCVDLGKAVEIKDIDYADIKAGDLIGYSGHIGMIIGVDGNKKPVRAGDQIQIGGNDSYYPVCRKCHSNPPL